jgi:hypothetical protein
MAEPWIAVLIAAGAALLASALTGYIAHRLARAERAERGRGELAAALMAFGYAVDRMGLEVGQLPPAPSRLNRRLNAGLTRVRMLDWLVGQASRHSLGRPAMRALDGLMATHNRLMLVAPVPVLEAAERIHELLGRVEDRDEEWKTRWQLAREQLLVASQNALAGD